MTRIVNQNPYLYGPGPVKRVPSGPFSMYGRAPPLRGFTMAAVHGVALALVTGLGYKFMFGDPQVKQIEDYYKENPPR